MYLQSHCWSDCHYLWNVTDLAAFEYLHTLAKIITSNYPFRYSFIEQVPKDQHWSVKHFCVCVFVGEVFS